MEGEGTDHGRQLICDVLFVVVLLRDRFVVPFGSAFFFLYL